MLCRIPHLGCLCAAPQGEPRVHDAAKQGKADIAARSDAAILALCLHLCPVHGLPGQTIAGMPAVSLLRQLGMRPAERLCNLQWVQQQFLPSWSVRSTINMFAVACLGSLYRPCRTGRGHTFNRGAKPFHNNICSLRCTLCIAWRCMLATGDFEQKYVHTWLML